ncbi:hypothetical protein [Deinococcus sp. RM]|uniref:hypothetical protein n=1 Tax=Deinococcus sp. RM TaxID=2316359 RepID=UPI001314640B|nr:hypothetical protein [Deinococcus sp. RM]
MTRPPPDLMTRLRARLRGEVSTEILEAYQRAGASIHPMLDKAEARRFMLRGTDRSWWDQPRHEQLATLCLWNAFILQTLGDTLLEADAAADPDTVGFAPRVTTDQARAYYAQVAVWLERSVLAQGDPTYDLNVTLPASLPDWSPAEPCPREHLAALMAALERTHAHLTGVMVAFDAQPVLPAHAAHATRLRTLFASTELESRALTQMYTPNASAELHELIEDRTRDLMADIYRLGQWLSMPALTTRVPADELGAPPPEPVTPRVPPAPPAAEPPPREQSPAEPTPTSQKAPGEPREPLWVREPWCASDPRIRDQLKRDPRATRTLTHFWQALSAPRDALTLLRDTETRCAKEGVGLAYATRADGTALGHSDEPPYAPIYRAVDTCQVGQVTLNPGDEFTLLRRGAVLQVVTGRFESTPDLSTDPQERP